MQHSGLELDEVMTARVRLRRWRLPAMGRAPRWPRVAHDTVEVAWADAGAMTYRVGSEELRAEPGDVVVVPAQHEHHTAVVPGTAATSVQLSAAIIAEMRDLVGGGLRFGVVRDAGIVALGGLILDEVRRADRGSLHTTDALAEALSVRLLRTGEKLEGLGCGTGSDPRIARAIDVLESRFAEPLTIDELARTAGMSRYHFSRAFRRAVGKSPYQYLVATRVRRAAELLRRQRHSVTEAAFSVGFGDLGRFARAFRQQLGCAPSRYAAAQSA